MAALSCTPKCYCHTDAQSASCSTFNLTPSIPILPLTTTTSARYTCGASLVTDQLLISAAHCFAATDGSGGLFPYTRIVARVGTETEWVEEEVTCVKLHESYSAFTYMNDIAILKLANPVPATYATDAAHTA